MRIKVKIVRSFPVWFVFCEECRYIKPKKCRSEKRRFCSTTCMLVWRSREVKAGRISLNSMHKFGKGAANPNWAGGVTKANELLRRTKRYKEWRKAVYERDNYCCINCGKRGGDINAHHIKEFSLYPESRYDLENGITLCVPCHQKTFKFYRNQYVEA
jgi:hypothetical protein